MSVITVSRRASVDEIAREMDRRGDVIERPEADIARLTHIAAVAKSIVESLATQDLDEPIADNGGTVLDFLIYEAKRIYPALCPTPPVAGSGAEG